MLNAMNVLVTGGAGYIGSHLADYFLSEGYTVTVVDNLSSGSMRNIEHNLANRRFSFVEGNILDKALMDKLVEGHDLICHLAAVVGIRYVLDNPVGSIVDNAMGTEIVLTAAHKYHRRIVFASSSEVYGRNPKLPFAEDDDRVFGSTRVSRWAYATAKALSEHLCYAYYGEGLPVSIVRYVNSYGPRIDPRGYGSVVAQFLTQALTGEPLTVHGDGSQVRCFTYVTDTVTGTFLAATRDEALGETFNIGNSTAVTINDLAGLVLRLTGSSSPVTYTPYTKVYGPFFEDMTRVVDSSKADKILGFRAETTLEEGIGKLMPWFSENLHLARQ
jgi:UDP-glucose 4-epimerase